MRENEVAKISPVDKLRYFKSRKRTSQRILCVLSPLREVPKIVVDMLFRIYQRLGRGLREVGQRDWNGGVSSVFAQPYQKP